MKSRKQSLNFAKQIVSWETKIKNLETLNANYMKSK